MSKPRTTRRIALGLTAAFTIGRRVDAQQVPAVSTFRPNRLIVPTPAGTPPDFGGRIIVEGLARLRGHSLVVENRAGADGVLGAEAFAQTRPGDALFYGFVGLVTVVPLTHEGRLPFDPQADLVPISTGAADIFVLAVAPALPAHTLAEFVEHVRARPGLLNWFASPGAPFLAFRAFLRDAGLDMAYVTYRGVPQALPDLASGRIQAALVPLGPVLPLAREERIRMLAVTGPERVLAAPDLPTTAEAGMPGFWQEGLQGLFGWRGMPEPAREEFAAQVREVLSGPGVAERFRAAGMVARGSTPAEFARELARHRARWAALARELGAKPPT